VDEILKDLERSMKRKTGKKARKEEVHKATREMIDIILEASKKRSLSEIIRILEKSEHGEIEKALKERM